MIGVKIVVKKSNIYILKDIYRGRDMVSTMKLSLTFIILFFSLTLVSAIPDSLGTFQQGRCMELYQLCDNCTFVNLTSIKYPNATIQKFDVTMEKNGVDYNYSFCGTSLNGDYLYNICGDKDGSFICETLSFQVTPSGNTGNEAFYIIVILLAYGISFIGFFGKNEWITIFGGLIMMFLGIYIVNTGIIIFRDVLTVAISYITIFLGAFFALFTTVSIIKENYG